MPIREGKRLRVYGASKLKHAELWLALHDIYPSIDWTARWPTRLKDYEETGKSDLAPNAAWMVDHEDVMLAECLFLYAEPDDDLKGALVEAGMAIASNRHVFVIGNHRQYENWANHPAVIRCRDFKHAVETAEYMYKEISYEDAHLS